RHLAPGDAGLDGTPLARGLVKHFEPVHHEVGLVLLVAAECDLDLVAACPAREEVLVLAAHVPPDQRVGDGEDRRVRTEVFPQRGAPPPWGGPPRSRGCWRCPRRASRRSPGPGRPPRRCLGPSSPSPPRRPASTR